LKVLQEGDIYQFAAMMGFPRGLTRFLDLGFCFTLGIEERFFFFWSSRPMIAVVREEKVVKTLSFSYWICSWNFFSDKIWAGAYLA
jgi:hypothetical protein